jgi:hypothetical protein
MKVYISHVLNHAIYLFRPIILDLIILLLNTDSSTAYKYDDCWKYLQIQPDRVVNYLQ